MINKIKNSTEKEIDINLIAFKVALYSTIGIALAQLLTNIIFMAVRAAA